MTSKLLTNPLRSRVEWGNCNNEKLKKIISPMLLVRHAESKFNKEIKNIEKLKNELPYKEYIQIKNKIRFTEEFMDCDITERGHEQCFDAGKLLRGVNIKYVFVSPLKRCLKTCQNILESAGLEPEVKVFPFIFEKIEDSCDLIRDINTNMSEWPNFDWSLFKEINHLPIYQLQYCDNVHREGEYEINSNIITPVAIASSSQESLGHIHISQVNSKQTKISYYHQAIQNFSQFNRYDHHKIALNAMERLNKNELYIESSIKTMERLFNLKEFLTKFNKENKLERDEKILLIGHSIVFKHLTAQYMKENSYEPSGNEIVLKNCEIAGLSFH